MIAVRAEPSTRNRWMAAAAVVAIVVAAAVVIGAVAGGAGDDDTSRHAGSVDDTYLSFARDSGAFVVDRDTTLRLGHSACATALSVTEPYAARQLAIGRLVSYEHLRWPVAKALVNAAYVSGLCTRNYRSRQGP